MRFLLVIRESASLKKYEGPSDASEGDAEPEHLLKRHGYRVSASCQSQDIRKKMQEADAVVLQLPITGIRDWEQRLSRWKPVPLLWWCSAETAASSLEACEEDIPVDGILTPTMSAHELHWALHLGGRHFFERRQWLEERAQLVSRLEERKWIDLAKSILCEINRIPEAEAYDVLRRRAMNERKRIVDIATSIVKAHQQLKT
ncbi:ANTAR domain-containing protein [Paenibacillus sp. alder61]|uniref:ANTAR domain-containing protein n=1 Tax=Paenibacillus faecis TaxID=862114 RepID=A0A5D0CQ79_9BACL|nr:MULTISPECIES: ANTAR domain-containing protein [Paenibacillus]MCA1293401.1 ANTAR domain-containing protein [Paenibacillus sp. alder61]TYA12061.1 ANTAR domain-containing protein [Paenibacillus faecis]